MSDTTTAAGGTGLTAKLIALTGAAIGAAGGFKTLADAQKDYDAIAAETVASTEKVTHALEAVHGATQNQNATVKITADSYTSLAMNTQLATDAANGNASSLAVGIAVQGEAKIANLQLAAATAEQTAALVELLKTQNMYNDSVASIITKGGQFVDWLAELKSSYDSGALSILSYKQALEALGTQLAIAFGTATGKAQQAIMQLIGVVNTLIATAGAGGQPTDFSAAAQFNKQFNTPPVKP
jgi:hypothetical protein